MTITFKYAMTVEGTRMFRGIVDEQVSIRPEWMFDPFQDTLPCFMAKGVERTGYILRIQARMDFMMGVR